MRVLYASFQFSTPPRLRLVRLTQPTNQKGTDKKLSYRIGTARRESLPKTAEMDVEMTT